MWKGLASRLAVRHEKDVLSILVNLTWLASRQSTWLAQIGRAPLAPLAT